MTKQEQFKAALARAIADGCYIIGSGHHTVGIFDNLRCWSVSGKDGKHAYIVTLISPTELHCECPSKVPCKHRALVAQRLMEERAKAAQAQPVVAVVPPTRDEDAGYSADVRAPHVFRGMPPSMLRQTAGK
jgi:hypothetical protein